MYVPFGRKKHKRFSFPGRGLNSLPFSLFLQKAPTSLPSFDAVQINDHHCRLNKRLHEVLINTYIPQVPFFWYRRDIFAVSLTPVSKKYIWNIGVSSSSSKRCFMTGHLYTVLTSDVVGFFSVITPHCSTKCGRCRVHMFGLENGVFIKYVREKQNKNGVMIEGSSFFPW